MSPCSFHSSLVLPSGTISLFSARHAQTLSVFKSKLKTHLFSISYSCWFKLSWTCMWTSVCGCVFVCVCVRGVHPPWVSVIDWQSLENVRLIFRSRGQLPRYFFVSMVTVRLFFCNSQTLQSRSCNWLVTCDLSLHPTDKHSHSHLFLATFIQRWPLIGPWCHIG